MVLHVTCYTIILIFEQCRRVWFSISPRYHPSTPLVTEIQNHRLWVYSFWWSNATPPSSWIFHSQLGACWSFTKCFRAVPCQCRHPSKGGDRTKLSWTGVLVCWMSFPTILREERSVRWCKVGPSRFQTPEEKRVPPTRFFLLCRRIT